MFQIEALAEESAVVRVRGDVDAGVAATFSSALDYAFARASQRVVVSFENCTFADSTAISVLVRARNAVGPRLVIVVPPSNRSLTRIFDIVGLTTSFGIVRSVGDALIAPIEA